MRNKSRAFLLYYRTDTHADEQEGLVRKGAAHSLEETMEWYHTPALSPEPAQTPATWLRVCTFGRFQIEWVDPATGERTPLPAERMQGQNAGTALGLFKALLTRPDRFATRSWLLEQFWPESRQRAAEERLNDVVSSLRGLLRPPGCTRMFVHFVHGANGRGAGYRLDAYPQLWCDADAFAWYVTHAVLLDRRGQDSTLLWERAYALAARGEYLPEQIEDEWSQQQREYLHGLLRDCVHRWTEVLRQRGCGEEAIVRLRGYWLAHPTDEDALRPLLELLGERERFTEAEQVYARAHAALAEDGCEPDTRTVETMEAVRAMQVQRKQVMTSTSNSARLARWSSSVKHRPRMLTSSQQAVLFSQRDTQDIIDEESDPDNQDFERNKKIAFPLWAEEQDGTLGETMNNERRKFIKDIGIGLGATRLGIVFPDFSSLASISEHLKQYQEQVPLHWNGFFTTPGQDAVTTIESVILHLQRLSPYIHVSQQGVLQTLLCQYHQLAADQLRDRGRINEALKHSDLAVYLAERLQHVELLAAALYRRGLTYFDAGRIDSASRDLSDALPFARVSR